MCMAQGVLTKYLLENLLFIRLRSIRDKGRPGYGYIIRRVKTIVFLSTGFTGGSF